MRLFARQFTDVLVLILPAAAVIAGIIGDLTGAVVVLLIVLLDAVVGCVQEYHAERAVAALKQLAASEARVMRAAQVTQGLRSNLSLLAAVLAALGLQLATIYHPLLNALFKTQPLTATELAICGALASVVFVAVEIEKGFRRRARRRRIIARI